MEKIVRENLYEFHKTGNPLKSLDLGYAAWVHSIFDACNIPRQKYCVENGRTYFFGNLYMWAYCPQVVELPSGLCTAGWLDLDKCTKLTELPRGMIIGSWLGLTGCTNIKELPDDLDVKRRILVNDDQTELIKFIKESKFKDKLNI